MSSQIPPDCVGVALVDDDAMALAHLESYFSGVEDLSVLLATRSTHEALRFVQSHQVDVLITDVHMENMDGVEMTREVLRSSPPTRVILLTTIDTDEDLLQGLGAGASLRARCGRERPPLGEGARRPPPPVRGGLEPQDSLAADHC